MFTEIFPAAQINPQILTTVTTMTLPVGFQRVCFRLENEEQIVSSYCHRIVAATERTFLIGSRELATYWEKSRVWHNTRETD